MGILTPEDKEAMKSDIQSIHEDWFKVVTIKNEKKYTASTPLGPAFNSNEVFLDEYNINALVYTQAQADRSKTFERSLKFAEGGTVEETDLFIKITKENLGSNIFDDQSVLEIEGVQYYVKEGIIYNEHDLHAKVSLRKSQ